MEKGNPPPYSPNAPPPGFHAPPPQPGAHIQTVIVHQQAPILGPTPQNLRCSSCHADIQTRVETEPNTKTHLFALLLFAFGCCLCSCIPYCTDSCQSQKHYCPNCGAYLGIHSD